MRSGAWRPTRPAGAARRPSVSATAPTNCSTRLPAATCRRRRTGAPSTRAPSTWAPGTPTCCRWAATGAPPSATRAAHRPRLLRQRVGQRQRRHDALRRDRRRHRRPARGAARQHPLHHREPAEGARRRLGRHGAFPGHGLRPRLGPVHLALGLRRRPVERTARPAAHVHRHGEPPVDGGPGRARRNEPGRRRHLPRGGARGRRRRQPHRELRGRRVHGPGLRDFRRHHRHAGHRGAVRAHPAHLRPGRRRQRGQPRGQLHLARHAAPHQVGGVPQPAGEPGRPAVRRHRPGDDRQQPHHRLRRDRHARHHGRPRRPGHPVLRRRRQRDLRPAARVLVAGRRAARLPGPVQPHRTRVELPAVPRRRLGQAWFRVPAAAATRGLHRGHARAGRCRHRPDAQRRRICAGAADHRRRRRNRRRFRRRGRRQGAHPSSAS